MTLNLFLTTSIACDIESYKRKKEPQFLFPPFNGI